MSLLFVASHNELITESERHCCKQDIRNFSSHSTWIAAIASFTIPMSEYVSCLTISIYFQRSAWQCVRDQEDGKFGKHPQLRSALWGLLPKIDTLVPKPDACPFRYGRQIHASWHNSGHKQSEQSSHDGPRCRCHRVFRIIYDKAHYVSSGSPAFWLCALGLCLNEQDRWVTLLKDFAEC